MKTLAKIFGGPFDGRQVLVDKDHFPPTLKLRYPPPSPPWSSSLFLSSDSTDSKLQAIEYRKMGRTMTHRTKEGEILSRYSEIVYVWEGINREGLKEQGEQE